MKYIQLFESWVETDDDIYWSGKPSKNFTLQKGPDDKMFPTISEEMSLLFKKDGRKYEIKIGKWSNDWKAAEKDLKELGRGWRLPSLEELEYIDNLLREEGKEWEFDYFGDFTGYFWTTEKAFDDPEEEDLYVWDFDKHSYRYLNPIGRKATFLYIREV